MKRLFPLVLLVVFGCSKTPLDLAKQGIRRDIGKYLNDPEYYESVSWGSLDSVFVTETPNQLSDLQFSLADTEKQKEFLSLISETRDQIEVIINSKGQQVYQDPDNRRWFLLRPEKIILNSRGDKGVQSTGGAWHKLNISQSPEVSVSPGQSSLSTREKLSVIEREVAEAWLKKQGINYTIKVKPILKRYIIIHTFRVRRPGQRKLLMKYQFILDSTFKIIDAEKQYIETFD